MNFFMQYDVIIIGAGPGGIFSAYELSKLCPEKKIAVFEEGQPLEKRKCPIDGKTVKHCVGCPTCAIMNGFGGAGAFSDGKYNLTNDFGGTLYEYIGKKQAMELMHYVDDINVACGGAGTKLYSTADSGFKRLCLQNNLHLLDASVRHLGTDINYKVLENLYAKLKDHVDFHFLTPVKALSITADGGYAAETLVMGQMSTGASSDLQRATDICRRMVTQYGMSDRLGLMALSTVSNPYLDGSTMMNCADSTSSAADEEIHKLLMDCYADAKNILVEHRALLDEIAMYLLSKETITGDEFMAYVNADSKKLTDGSEAEEAPEQDEAPSETD